MCVYVCVCVCAYRCTYSHLKSEIALKFTKIQDMPSNKD